MKDSTHQIISGAILTLLLFVIWYSDFQMIRQYDQGFHDGQLSEMQKTSAARGTNP